eukprot:1138599-Pelagomonas_calceolata.AAC.6
MQHAAACTEQFRGCRQSALNNRIKHLLNTCIKHLRMQHGAACTKQFGGCAEHYRLQRMQPRALKGRCKQCLLCDLECVNKYL